MRKFLSEFLSTFFLVFGGTGAILINQQRGGAITHLGISFVFVLVVTAMIFTFVKYSGPHMNPAVTIALAIGNYFPKKRWEIFSAGPTRRGVFSKQFFDNAFSCK